MPKFTCEFTRTVTQDETFERDYEADTAEEAQAMADEEAEASNSDCPDDTSMSGGEECGAWRAADVKLAS